jgi:hypothetical protein
MSTLDSSSFTPTLVSRPWGSWLRRQPDRQHPTPGEWSYRSSRLMQHEDRAVTRMEAKVRSLADGGLEGGNGTWLEALIDCLGALTDVLERVSATLSKDPDSLLTAEQLGDLFQLPARTIKDQTAAKQFSASPLW